MNCYNAFDNASPWGGFKQSGWGREKVPYGLDLFTLREGPWKFTPWRGSGGFSFPKNIKPAGGEPAGQLYDLATDPHETHNVAASEPAVAAKMTKRLAEIQSSTRTRDPSP